MLSLAEAETRCKLIVALVLPWISSAEFVRIRDTLSVSMKRILWLVLWACAGLTADLPAGDVFVEKPYLQMGDAAKLAREERVEVLWHSRDEDAAWRVEVQ